MVKEWRIFVVQSSLVSSSRSYLCYDSNSARFLPDIIGKAGFCIRAIQTHTGVKVSTPSDYTKVLPSGETIVPSKVKIVLAGAKDKVAVARSLILDLCKYYYTPVTHPGLTHVEMDIEPRYYNYVIGSKGSEIKHIQANYKVVFLLLSRKCVAAPGVSYNKDHYHKRE